MAKNGTMTTLNGKEIPGTITGLLQFAIAKWGAVGILVIVFGAGFWFCGSTLLETLKESLAEAKTHSKIIEKSTERIATSMEAEQETDRQLVDTMEDIKLMHEAQVMMVKDFQAQVKKDHPEQIDKLNKILDAIEQP